MIIVAFAGTGKTTFCENHENAIDFTVMKYKYENFDEVYAKCNGETIKANPELIINTGWQYDYYEDLIKTYEENKDKIIIIPTDTIIMQWLESDEIPFTIVYPAADLKEEYRERYIERGNNEEFIKVFIDNWDYWQRVFQFPKSAIKIELKAKQYLGDVIVI